MDDKGKYYQVTASISALISGGGTVYGYIVNSHTTGTIKLYDSLTQANTVLHDTFSFPTGSGVYKFPAPVSFYTGLSVTVGGTANVTLIATPF